MYAHACIHKSIRCIKWAVYAFSKFLSPLCNKLNMMTRVANAASAEE